MVVWIAFFAGGCALFSKKPPEESLRERVTAYMQARVDSRWNDVYEFFDKGYKEQISRDEFLAMPENIDFIGFTLQNIEMAASKKEAAVSLTVDVEVKGFTFKDNPEKQTWIKERSKWVVKRPLKTQPPF